MKIFDWSQGTFVFFFLRMMSLSVRLCGWLVRVNVMCYGLLVLHCFSINPLRTVFS